jgi:hypothetical protein
VTNRARAQGLNSRLSPIIFRRLGGGFASAERYLNASSGAVCPLCRRGRLTMKSRRGAGEATWLHADARCMTGTVPDIAHRFTVAFNAGDVEGLLGRFTAGAVCRGPVVRAVHRTAPGCMIGGWRFSFMVSSAVPPIQCSPAAAGPPRGRSITRPRCGRTGATCSRTDGLAGRSRIVPQGFPPGCPRVDARCLTL